MRVLSRHYIILFVLVMLFAAPGLSAYLFYHNSHWLSAAKTNRGELLATPIKLEGLEDERSKWRLLLWNPASCENSCSEKLTEIAKIRLALGRRLYNVDSWLLLGPNAASPSESLAKMLKDGDIRFKKLGLNEYNKRDLPNHPMIYIQNPKGFLVLAYSYQSKPDDVYQDLKHLLTNKE